MAEKTLVEKAGKTVGIGMAMASDVAGAIKTAINAAATSVTQVLNTAPAKKASEKKAAKKAVTKKAAKKAPAKKVAKKAAAKKTPVKKGAKKTLKKPPKKAGRLRG
jgi:ribosomal protein S5